MRQEKRKRILVSTHQLDEMSMIESRLKARDYDVTTAETSIDVIHHVNKQHFDLILLDAKMEEVRHTELAKVLRKRSFLRSIPILMMADADDVASLISSVDRGFDDFFIRPIDPLALQLRVALNIRRAEERIETNPLTQLPGNVAIEKAIMHLIEAREVFSVLYMDLDNFKALNDSLSYEKGDDVIKQTAHILETNANRQEGRIPTFVGHVGGDDFILIACPTITEKLGRSIIRDFNRTMPTYYPEGVRKSGFVLVKNRKGVVEKMPLVSISIAEISNEFSPILSPAEVSSRLTELKKFLKLQEGSNHLKDRRNRPFASLEEAEQAFQPIQQEKTEPLGQMLLKAGIITEEVLSDGLEQHFETGQPLGQILVSRQAVKSSTIGEFLQKKLGIPYAALNSRVPKDEMLELLDSNFVKTHRVVPLEVSQDKVLQLGMVEPHDLTLIREVEEICGGPVKPSLILESEFEEFFANYYSPQLG